MLPNGHLLAMAVERKTMAQCVEAGFDSTLLQDGYVAVEYLVEFMQTGDTTYTIVWQWHLWDHMIQDKYPSRQNYGTVKDHPELCDVAATTGSKVPAFWNHGNSVDYNAKFDQICLSIRGNSEFWIIDHGTTTAEAAGHSGGKYGKGGDILYRWGNPQAYDRGTPANRILYQQHDAQWIPDSCPGASHILIFNNGIDRPSPQYSTIEEVVLPCDSQGVFPALPAGQAWLPSTSYWTYKAANPTDFYSAEISGVQRLPNGNTLICEGLKGHFFEITPEKQIVWRYVSPLVDQDTLAQGDDPSGDIDPRGHQNNAVFKIHRYAPDYPGLTGRDLTPTAPLEKNPLPDLTTHAFVNQCFPDNQLPAITMQSASRIHIRIPASFGASTFTVCNSAGAQVFKRNIGVGSFAYNKSAFPAGLYFFSISNGKQCIRHPAILTR
jgi:hypothetical protein